MKDDEATAERNQVLHQETIPRNFYIKTKELEDHGYTAKCPGRLSIMKGTSREAHSTVCSEPHRGHFQEH